MNKQTLTEHVYSAGHGGEHGWEHDPGEHGWGQHPGQHGWGQNPGQHGWDRNRDEQYQRDLRHFCAEYKKRGHG